MILGYRLAPLATLHVGDCIEVMAAMPEASVDAVVCDPPYGLEFMGKEWDALSRNLMRADSASDIERVNDYGQSYKGRRSKLPDLGSAAAHGAAMQEWHEAWAREAYRVLKPGGHLLAFGGTRTFHRLTCGIEDAGFEVRDCLSWLYGSGFPKSLDVSKAIDKAAGAKREVVGKYQPPDGTAWNLAQADGTTVDHAPGTFTASGTRTLDVTAPATDAAREWQGWGTALKPAWEPCVVARKPLAGTVAANVQAHGTGALNIDGCRIAASDPFGGGKAGTSRFADGYAKGDGWQAGSDLGRWPANVALDEAAAAMLDAQSGERSHNAPAIRKSSGESGYGGMVAHEPGDVRGGYGDTGGASRFYYVAKASKKDRTAGGTVDNTHPTVKPTALMAWLVRLVTPPGGVVLDPFAGSGSTLVAAVREGVRCIGIEREQEYAEIIAGRVAAEAEVPTLFAA